MKPPKSNLIPAEVFVPILRRYIEAYQAKIGTDPGETSCATLLSQGTLARSADIFTAEHRFIFCNAVRVLADECGMDPSTLDKYLRGYRKWIPFRFADALLCKMNKVHEWHSLPLSDYYQSVNVMIEFPDTTPPRRFTA